MNNSIFNIAVLIDGDNAQAKIIKEIIEEVSKYGKVTIRRIYGDWTTPQMNSWKDILNNYSISPIQKFNYTTGKNSTDSSLIIDAMDILHGRGVQGFCIVSSDSDYTGLAKRIREEGLFVMGIGRKNTPIAFVNSCEIFTFTENLIQENYSDSRKEKAENKQAQEKAEDKKAQEKTEDKTQDKTADKKAEKEKTAAKAKSSSKKESTSKNGKKSETKIETKSEKSTNKKTNGKSESSTDNRAEDRVDSKTDSKTESKSENKTNSKSQNSAYNKHDSSDHSGSTQVDIKLIDKAFDISINEEEEAYISTVGTSLRKLDPSFDSRTYGYKTLTKLFESLDKYEVVKNLVNGLNHPLVRLK